MNGKKITIAHAIEIITEHTGLSKEKIEQLTLADFDEILAKSREKARIEFELKNYCERLKEK